MKDSNRINYFKTYSDDFIESKNQNIELSNDYKWINDKLWYKICSKISYFFAYIFGMFYCKVFLHIKIENRSILKKYKDEGYFLYGNHTQVLGDVFIPAVVCNPKRIYTVASTANLGVPVIGRLLPFMGILPIPKNVSKIKNLLNAINKRIEGNSAVVIYPEAHVWPYYTEIRPFANTAFKFPVNYNSLSFCMTTTYQKRKIGSKPKITIYVDGPFFTDNMIEKKERADKLCKAIHECMEKRSKNSDYKYIKYERECNKI